MSRPELSIARAVPGQLATPDMLTDVSKLITAYFTLRPDPAVAAQRIAFGTSGHRGSAFDVSFNEWHVLAMTQALCDYRHSRGISGPLFLGIDTHALSTPASVSAIEVLAANGIELMLAVDDDYTPTPVISHAILRHNRGRDTHSAAGLADGIVITPSHNPPRDGGFKYNPPHGGPAEEGITRWIEAAANTYLDAGLTGVRRVSLASALNASTTHRHDYRSAYIQDLDQVVDMAAIRESNIRIGVDPLGGAGVHYWPAIAEHYGLNLNVLNVEVDPTFRFIPLDWDRQIRMDPSSRFAMQTLIARKDEFDIAFACDTDHDRHGIVAPGVGLLMPNHYLCVAIDYLLRHRANWPAKAAIGKTVVSTALIDRVAARLGCNVFEVPVGFKWFSAGLFDASLNFAGEESAGASFLRRDGTVWTTDKDGITAALLSAEITAVTGKNPGTHYETLAGELGRPLAKLVGAAATPEQKRRLSGLSQASIGSGELAGEPIDTVLTHAPGNGAAIGGVKVMTANGWFAARPSGTESLYKIYAESFINEAHLQNLVQEAQAIVDQAIGST